MTFQEYKQSITIFIDALNTSLARVLSISDESDESDYKKRAIFLHCFMLIFYKELKKILDNSSVSIEKEYKLYNYFNEDITKVDSELNKYLNISMQPEYLENSSDLKKTIHFSLEIAKLIKDTKPISSIQAIREILFLVSTSFIVALVITSIALVAAGINTHLFTLCGILLLSMIILTTLFVVSYIVSYFAPVDNNYKDETSYESYCNKFNEIDSIKTLKSRGEIINSQNMEKLFPDFNKGKDQKGKDQNRFTKDIEMHANFFQLREHYTIKTDDFKLSPKAI